MVGELRRVTDMLGRDVNVPVQPQRIVSLCPSITETLFEIGLADQLVGLTRYCLHPAEQVAQKTKVGGTKKPDFEAIKALQPDLIVAEKEENRREDVELLAKQWPVYVTEIRDIAAAHGMMNVLGDVCDRQVQAQQLSHKIESAWQSLPRLEKPLRVAYLIWRKPWMAAGSDTYIDAVLRRLGLENVFAGAERYPQFSNEELMAKNPDLVLLSSEPFPFAEKHIRELEMIVPHSDIQLVDGEAFSWYGAHMLPATRYLEKRLLSWTAL